MSDHNMKGYHLLVKMLLKLGKKDISIITRYYVLWLKSTCTDHPRLQHRKNMADHDRIISWFKMFISIHIPIISTPGLLTTFVTSIRYPVTATCPQQDLLIDQNTGIDNVCVCENKR